ncbi:MAG: hypothetical protein HUU50_18995 [Candidatus Brocadiae bacterium]|nr:hypothetical protein [Candidatus Brocadiia bacterium]
MSECLVSQAKAELEGIWRVLLFSLLLGILFGLAFKYSIPYLWCNFPENKKITTEKK